MRRFLLTFLPLLSAALIAGDTSAPATSAPATSARPPGRLPGAQIFDRPTLLAFRIELSSEALDQLRDDPRKNVPANVTVDGHVFTNVALHLKGSVGSFRGVDQRPALTLSFNKFVPGRRFLGLREIHLNNSVQDRSFMNEYLASDLFRAANVPTPRVAFGTVEFDHRKLGLYVLKEGFTEDFLRCFFPRTDGNLYDGGFLHDIDQTLKRNVGRGVGDGSDLEALGAAASETDKSHRWERLRQVLDVDRFASYAALSVLLSDWDGYVLHRNNYRVYFNPADGRAVFIPHGMDQMFQRTDMDLSPYFEGLVGQGLFDTTEGRRLYESRCRVLFTEVFRFERMTNAMARVAEVLRPVQPDIDRRAAGLREQIAARIAYLKQDPLLQTSPVRATSSPTPDR